jgi:hypothetical protein
MRFLNIFRKKSRKRTRPAPTRQTPRDEAAPKNGPLTLAVLGTLIIMVVLVALNLRLLRNPSIAGKVFRQSIPTQPGPPASATAKLNCPESKQKKPCVVPLTFYDDLTAPDEKPEDSEETTEEKTSDFDGAARDGQGNEVSGTGNKEEKTVTCTSNPSQRRPPSERSLRLPKSKPERKWYTVQVGTFSNPGIAKQWALKWQARGYKVALKPVARPKTGVTYRLYLGKFSSEKRADKLVKRLKSKEGISALRLAIRN